MRPFSSRISTWCARKLRHELEALDDVDRLEQLLALLGGHVRAVGDHVGQEPGLGDVAGRRRRPPAGPGAPLATYCSIWAWTVRISAWTSRPSGVVGHGSTAREVRLVWLKPAARARLALDDRPDGAVLELDDLGDLGQRADGVQLGRDRRCPPAPPGAG
jgi:hypothetical protein